MRRAAGALAATALASALVLVAAPPTPAFAHTPHDQIPSVAATADLGPDGGVAMVISRDRLLRSTDGGQHWSRVVRGITTASPIADVAVAPSDPDRMLLVSRGGGAFRSDDGGTSWRAVDEGLALNLAWVAISPRDPDVAVASGAYGAPLYRTGDGGEHWESTGIAGAASVGFAARSDLVLVGDLTGQLHRSDDAGTTWGSPKKITEGAKAAVRALAIDDRTDGEVRVLAGTDREGLLVSTDGGATFTAGTKLGKDDRVRDVALSPADATTAFASTWAGGACRSTDRGDTWTCTRDGLSTDHQADELPTKLPQFGELAVGADGRTLLLAGYDGLFRSTDGGASWAEVETQGPRNVVSLAVTAGASGAPPTVAIAQYLNGVLVSDDGGGSWAERDEGLATAFDWALREDYVARMVEVDASPAYAEDRTLFASQRGYLARSTDAGETWEVRVLPGIANEQDRPPDYFTIAISPTYADDGTVLVGTDRGKVFRTTDRGDSWERLDDLGAEVVALVLSPTFDRDQTAVVATIGGVSITTDGGDSWTVVDDDVPRPTGLALAGAFPDDATMWLATNEGLYRSTGPTDAFEAVDDPAFPADAKVEGVAAAPGADVLLVSVRGLGLFRSTDGGERFEAVADDLRDEQLQLSNWYHATSPPIAFSPDFERDQTVYGYADEHLLRSTDAGETWTEVERPTATHDTDPSAAPAPLLSLPEPGVEGIVRADGTVAASASADDDGGDGTATTLVVGGTVALAAVVAGGVAWRRRRRGRAS